MGLSQFHRVSLSFIGFSRSDVRLSALVRLSRSLQLTLFSQPPFDHLLAVVATASRTGQFEGQFISRSSDQQGLFSTEDFLPTWIPLSFLLYTPLYGSSAIIYQSIGTRYILTCICCRRDEGNRSFFSLFNLVVPRFVRFILEPALL